ncbi:MAG: hypothetical protein ABI777_10985 [Betaproteobacteria bacterium]
MTFSKSLVLIALVASGVAAAQTAAPAASAAAPAAANCPKPDAHPGRLASDNQRKGWGKEVQTWTTCMKKYVAEVQAEADVAVKAANAAVARSNAAVNEYNAVVNDLQAQNDAAAR